MRPSLLRTCQLHHRAETTCSFVYVSQTRVPLSLGLRLPRLTPVVKQLVAPQSAQGTKRRRLQEGSVHRRGYGYLSPAQLERLVCQAAQWVFQNKKGGWEPFAPSANAVLEAYHIKFKHNKDHNGSPRKSKPRSTLSVDDVSVSFENMTVSDYSRAGQTGRLRRFQPPEWVPCVRTLCRGKHSSGRECVCDPGIRFRTAGLPCLMTRHAKW